MSWLPSELGCFRGNSQQKSSCVQPKASFVGDRTGTSSYSKSGIGQRKAGTAKLQTGFGAFS